MKTIFPQTNNRDWMQQNKGDLYPVLYSTRNINLEKRGYIGLSRRMSYVQKSSASAVNIPSIAVHTAAQEYKIAYGGGDMYDLTYNLVTASRDTDATTLSQYTDVIGFNGQEYYTQSATGSVYYRAGGSGAYTTIAASLSTGSTPHPMEVDPVDNLLCIGNGNTVKTITSANALGVLTLTLPGNYTVIWLKYLNNRMYVGTESQSGGNGALFEWDLSSGAANASYEVQARAIVCGYVYAQSIVCLTSRGELLRFSGGGFTQLATLPFFQDKDASWGYRPSVYDHQAIGRCMEAVDEYLYINVSNNILIKNNAYEVMPEFPCGIYQYHPDFGLVHKLSLSQSSTSNVTDYGQTYGTLPNAMMRLQDAGTSYPSSPTYANGTRFLAGGTLTDNTLTENVYLLSMTSGEARGEFVTSKLLTDSTLTTQQNLFVKFRNVTTSTDKIIVKYRNIDKASYPLVFTPEASRAVTWTSATTFTSTSSLMSTVEAGEEVMVMSGNGAGSLAHISSITFLTGTYTIVLDESIVGVAAGDLGGVFIDNWTKSITVADYLNTSGYEQFAIGTDGKWVQIKVELRGSSEPMIEEMSLLSQPYQP